MAIRKVKGLLTYVSGYAEIENNIIANKIPIILVIEKSFKLQGTNRVFFKEFKRVKGFTSINGKYDFNIYLPEGEYYMYVIFDDKRIGKPDAYAYYGKTRKTNVMAGGRKGFDYEEIKIVPKKIDKILMFSLFLVEMDFDTNGCEWRIEEKINGVTQNIYLINNVSTISPNHLFTDIFEKLTIAKYGLSKKEIEFQMGNHYEFIFNEMDGDVIDSKAIGLLEIDTRNENFIISQNTILKIIDIKDRYDYSLPIYITRINNIDYRAEAQIRFIYS